MSRLFARWEAVWVTLTLAGTAVALENVPETDEIGLSTLWRVEDLIVRQIGMTDPLVEPMLTELQLEYTNPYGAAARERDSFPVEEFAPPHGAWILLMAGDEPVAGGAFRRYDGETAELKRGWTSAAYRDRGVGRRVVAELEILAAVRGYSRMYLTAGARQTEARALYLAAGYTPLFDLDADPATVGHLAFEKALPKY